MPNDLLAKRLLTVFCFVSLLAMTFHVYGESTPPLVNTDPTALRCRKSPIRDCCSCLKPQMAPKRKSNGLELCSVTVSVARLEVILKHWNGSVPGAL